jgi:hypothetical protein
MTDIYKGTSGFGNYLLITRANAERLTATKNSLKFYSTDTISEFDQVFQNLAAFPKLELFSELNKSGVHPYDGFLRSEFQYGFLQLYVTGNSHYTSPSFLIRNSEKCNYYLAPAIDVLQYPAVSYMDFSHNESGVDRYFEEVSINENDAGSLVDAFYDNTRNIYSGKRVDGPSKNPTGLQQLKDILTLGDAVVIQKHKLIYVPFENLVSAAVGVGALKSRVIGEKCVDIDVFIIKCEHYPKARNFQLDVINTAPNFNGNLHVLQVVAQTDKPETVTIEYDKATCIHDDNECPSIIVDGGDYYNQRVTSSPFKLKVKPFKKREDLGFWDFMQSYFLPDMRDLKPEIYTVTTGGCSDISGNKALIHCFPTFEWSGKVEAGMKHKYNAVGLLEDREFSFDGEIKYVRNGNTTKFGGKTTSTNNKEVTFPKLESMLTSIASKLDDIKNNSQETVLNSVGKTLSDLKKEAGSDDLIIVELVPPKISLGGGIKLAESSKTGEVGMAGNVTLDLSPLIGLKVETDLLDWLIMTFSGGLGGGLGGFLLKIKGLAARSKAKIAEIESSGVLTSAAKKDMSKELTNKEGKAIFDAELYVKFTAEGSISAKCEWKKDVDDSWLSAEGDKTASASAKIAFKLAAVAKAKAEAFCVKISIGAELHVAGAKSSAEGIGIETTLFATTAENKPALGGNIRFTGMAIYFTSWAEAGVKTAKSDEKTVKNTTGRGTGVVIVPTVNADTPSSETATLAEKKQYDKSQIIFNESTWPDTKTPQPLSQAEL